MALAYTAPTWTDGSGEGISASNLQAISNCIEGLVQGPDKAIHEISFSGSTFTVTYADGTQETFETSVKGISSVAKTGTAGLVDTYTITYSDGTTTSFTVTNGAQGATGPEGPEGPEGPQGPAGADGADGVSPEVTITSVTGGHSVKITDADHPTGQTFNVMDGEVPITTYSETLTAGSTSVTFTNVSTTANSIIEVGTSEPGLEYITLTNSGTSYTVTYDAQASDVTIYLIVTEVA